MIKQFSFPIVLCFILLVSCSKDDAVDIQPHRTIIVYMAADNDLSEDAANDIEEMKQGFSGNHANAMIKSGMRQMIERVENDSAAESRASDESANNETRQGETPNGAALPP